MGVTLDLNVYRVPKAATGAAKDFELQCVRGNLHKELCFLLF